jgi:hypothetical protein
VKDGKLVAIYRKVDVTKHADEIGRDVAATTH